MTEGILIGSNILTIGIRIFLFFCLIAKLLVSPKWPRWIAAASVGAAVLMTVLSTLPIPVYYVLGVEVAVIAFLAARLLNSNFRMSLFLSFFYEVSVAFWDFLLSACLGVLFRSDTFLSETSLEYLAAVSLVRLLMIGLTVFVWKKHDLEAKGTLRMVSVIVVLGLVSIVTLSEQSILVLRDDVLTTWIILSIVLMLSVLVFNMNRQYEVEKEFACLKAEQAELLERDYTTLNKAYSINAKLFHDFNNHIGVLHQLLTHGKDNQAIRYLEDLRGPVQEIAQNVWTGDEAVDYLINSKVGVAEKENIKTQINVEFPKHTNIRGADLSAILGNLLDNALEASHTAQEDFRFLHLTIRRINNMLLIKVENGCEAAPVTADGELQTTKADGGLHGWGIKSARTAAEKYDGTVQTSCTDHVFRSVVTLSYDAVSEK